jgi:hypothetical protein
MKPTIYAPALALATPAACSSLDVPSGYQPPPPTVNGNTADPSAGSSADLVVMDHFLYGEPQPLPE